MCHPSTLACLQWLLVLLGGCALQPGPAVPDDVVRRGSTAFDSLLRSGGDIADDLTVQGSENLERATLRWTELGFDSSDVVVAERQLPFHRAGQVLVVDVDRFLVSGLERSGPLEGFGVLMLVRIDPTDHRILFEESARYPDFDPIDVHYNAAEEALYTIDYTRGRVLRADWNPDRPLPARGAFAVKVDDAGLREQFPSLPSHEIHIAMARLEDAGLYEHPEPDGVIIYMRTTIRNEILVFRIDRVGCVSCLASPARLRKD